MGKWMSMFVGALLFVGGCQSLLGLDDYTLGSDAGEEERYVDDQTDGAADGDADTDSDADSDSDTDTDTDSGSDGDGDGDTDTDADADGDSDVDSDADSDADSDTDADTSSDTEVDTGDPFCEGDDVWHDTESDLCWPIEASDFAMSWGDALSYCGSLTVGGYDDWELPSIDDLRSLVRGCPATEMGGECAVIGSSTAEDYSGACHGCTTLNGPGLGGCYWDDVFGGSYATYWSSSLVSGYDHAWHICFYNAKIGSVDVVKGLYEARCVR